MQEGKRLSSEEVIRMYRETRSIKLTATRSGLTRQTVRRILITAGEYSTDFTEQIREMQAQGKSIDTIAAELGVTRTWIVANMPYSKGAYSVGPRSDNALYIAERRKRRKQAAQDNSVPEAPDAPENTQG